MQLQTPSSYPHPRHDLKFFFSIPTRNSLLQFSLMSCIEGSKSEGSCVNPNSEGILERGLIEQLALREPFV